nr:vegetative incompatibility protein het-e-1 [Quercus suber]
MRLLKRDDEGRVSFTRDLSEKDLAGPEYEYAILSHRWGKPEEEVTYEDILNGNGTSKPGIGSQKIQFCVRQTRQDGLEYFWVDTCCIDKSKETELGKALRSMYRWYANSQKCYVFLSDVPFGADNDELHRDWEQDFRGSVWFKRGWTLQELIAPSSLDLFSKHGKSLGTKASLERQLNEITHIPIKALRGEALTEFTVQERRQWQEGRMTQEPEDMVYSLLGLLNVSMPVMYGEGRRLALQRLENEIRNVQKVETQHFVARVAELQELRSSLSSDGSRKVTVLHGLGGIGKTQLAIAYAKRYKDHYSGVLWLNAKDKDSLRSSFTTIAKQITREHTSVPRLHSLDLDRDVEEVVDAVKAWLSTLINTRWLIICDNYDNPKTPGNADPSALDLRLFLPEAYQGSIIITTRSAEVKLGHCMRISKLGALRDGLKILEDASGRKDLADGRSMIFASLRIRTNDLTR